MAIYRCKKSSRNLLFSRIRLTEWSEGDASSKRRALSLSLLAFGRFFALPLAWQLTSDYCLEGFSLTYAIKGKELRLRGETNEGLQPCFALLAGRSWDSHPHNPKMSSVWSFKIKVWGLKE